MNRTCKGLLIVKADVSVSMVWEVSEKKIKSELYKWTEERDNVDFLRN